MELIDINCLKYIQNKLGGSIKMRSGAKAWRYRQHNREDIKKQINNINGYIRNSKRIKQLHRICQKLDIPVILPRDPGLYWFAGFFDADGTITFSFKNNKPQLSIRITNKQLLDVQWYKQFFGGSIYFDSSSNGCYNWSVQSRTDIQKVQDTFKGKIRSHKAHRVFLIQDYFFLFDQKAYEEFSPLKPAWLDFKKRWERY